MFCRVRPYLDVYRRRIHEPISTKSEKVVVESGGTRKEFEFDKAFPQEVTQGELSWSKTCFPKFYYIFDAVIGVRDSCSLKHCRRGFC